MTAHQRCPVAGARFNLLFWVLKHLPGSPDTGGLRLRKVRVRLVGLETGARVSP